MYGSKGASSLDRWLKYCGDKEEGAGSATGAYMNLLFTFDFFSFYLLEHIVLGATFVLMNYR